MATAIAQWLGSRQLEKLKAKYAAELEAYKSELERSQKLLQAEIDKTFLVTKVHFETEFNALKEVFALLAEIRLTMPGLRASLRIVPADETKVERLKALFEASRELEDASNKLAVASENLKPFYPSEIYSQIGECIQSVRHELNDIALSGPDALSGDAYWKADKNFKEFMLAYTRVSEMIRDRISRLTIIRTS